MKWSPEKITLLKSLAGNMSTEDIAKYMDTTASSIKHKAGKLKLSLAYSGSGSGNRVYDKLKREAIKQDILLGVKRSVIAETYDVPPKYVDRARAALLKKGDLKPKVTRPFKPEKQRPKPFKHASLIAGVFN